MMLRLYAGAGRLAAPGLRAMLRRRVRAGKEIEARLAEREGRAGLPRPEGRLIWLHAASVGETMSALPVIAALHGRAEILLTTGTATSAELAAARLPLGAIHQFAPLDVPSWTARFLSHWRPDAAVFLESEIWPNLLRGCDGASIPRLLINARLSAASARKWQRAPGLAKTLLGGFRAILAQSASDAQRLRDLGAAAQEWGNLKFFSPPLPADEAALAVLRAQIPGPLWLAASTHPGEEEICARAHCLLTKTRPDLVTIIVPRHPARGAEAAKLCADAPRRALGQAPLPGQIYIADTLGELGLFFRLAPFAFIGNSLAGHGGHNIIEPALLACPVIAGPHLENFEEPAVLLRRAGMLAEVTDEASLAARAAAWLDSPPDGAAAAACFAGMAELPRRIAALILEQLP